VWIQLPSGHRKARVYRLLQRTRKRLVTMGVVLGGRGNTPMHPFLNDHAQRRFFLVFNGSEFTWATVSIVLHTSPQMGTIGPVEAVIKWLKVTGVGRMSSRGRRGGRPLHFCATGQSEARP
jgi:hypothetical protein